MAHRQDRQGTARCGAAGLLLAVGLFLLPGAMVSPMPARLDARALLPSLPPGGEESVTAGGGSRDRGRIVRLARQDGSVEELSMEDYLWGVVAAEMPASFEPEALKAQAAAARTYTVQLQESPGRHEGADLCDDSGCCQAYTDRSPARLRWGLQAEEFEEKIARAVAETDGLGVLYGGAPIQAVFFSSSSGRTLDAAEVWGSSVPYLQGVVSPEGEEVPNRSTTVTLSAPEVKMLVLERYPGADLTGGPEGWFSKTRNDSAGGVAQLELGGLTLTGMQVRELFGLRSACFQVEYTDDGFVFSVTGYGHGVGMSQYGANAMAAAGAGFEEILTWYYSGTEVGNVW